MKRTLGKSGIEVSAMGLGCWAIGGAWIDANGQSVGWGKVDDRESIRAIHRALDLGVTLFDTSNNYGCGHSETILGQALMGQRHNVVIATKFGYTFNEQTRQLIGSDASPDHIRWACEQSLRRLGTDHIDLYQFHIYDYPPDEAIAVRDVLEQLVEEGKIRWYGWSTNSVERARVFADGPHCTAIQHSFSLVNGSPEMIALCKEHKLASINRGPLAMGILTGKLNAETQFPVDDIRHTWNLKEGQIAGFLQTLDRVRGTLTSDKRTLAQAALGWLWAYDPIMVPIPGFKTVQQVEENVGAMPCGPLTDHQMQEIHDLIGR